MVDSLTCVSPVDGRVYVERPLATAREIDAALTRAGAAQKSWKSTPLAQRQALMMKAVDAFVTHKAEIAGELTRMMGRPLAQTPGEVNGFEERARYMIAAAGTALAPLDPGDKPGFKRYVAHEPLGILAIIAPWNYPYLTAVNAVTPALLAG